MIRLAHSRAVAVQTAAKDRGQTLPQLQLLQTGQKLPLNQARQQERAAVRSRSLGLAMLQTVQKLLEEKSRQLRASLSLS